MTALGRNREALRALERVAKSVCYQCPRRKPFRTFPLKHKRAYYIHLRVGEMATSNLPGDICQAPNALWREYERLGGSIDETK